MTQSNHARYEQWTAESRAQVRAACLDLVARGVHPSERRLQDLLPGLSRHAIVARRRALIDAGEIVLPGWDRLTARGRPPRGPRTPAGPGLTGRTPAEREEVAARIAEVRAQKADEPPAPWTVPGGKDRRPNIAAIHGGRSMMPSDTVS